MDFTSLAFSRRSRVHFLPGYKVSESDFLGLLEVTRFAPSGYNAQPWKFDLIQDESILQKLHKIAYKQDKILTSGNVVVVLGDREFGQREADRIVLEWKQYRGFSNEKADSMRASLTKDRDNSKKREMTIRNCSLAAMTFMYAAESKGFVTCPMMGFRQLDLKKLRGYEEPLIPIMMIALGKPDPEHPEEAQLPRKTAQELWYK